MESKKWIGIGVDGMVIIGQWSSKSTFGANDLASEAKRKKPSLRQNGANHLGAGNTIVRMSCTMYCSSPSVLWVIWNLTKKIFD